MLELTYTAWDLQCFARDLGWRGPPFRWDEARRPLLRAELDAAFFHLYAIGRDDVEYIMGTFPIVARKDQAAWGEYRTHRLILEAYDAMAKAAQGGVAYHSPLDPAIGPSLHPPLNIPHAEAAAFARPWPHRSTARTAWDARVTQGLRAEVCPQRRG
ncbi:MAG: hypothetical protein DLM54_10215 [Acidimicrobiales bacterium]|nr:MAG: hypothetical protein DLM54_10215 [Acidimicrobiales bacterium]